MQIAIEIISLWLCNIAIIQRYPASITAMLAGMWYTWEFEGTRLITRKDYSIYVGRFILASAKLEGEEEYSTIFAGLQNTMD